MATRAENPAGRCWCGLSRHGRRAVSLAEVLVVIGVIALLVAISLPPLQLARRQAMRTQCAAQLQQLGAALEQARSQFGFYPYWDDDGYPIRFTWVDVLVQLRLIGGRQRTSADASDDGEPVDKLVDGPVSNRLAYCPADELPDALNSVRYSNLIYPRTRERGGIDYSYGIGVPLSAGGWAWQPLGDSEGAVLMPRRFRGHERGTSNRVLAGDAYASMIYNLSGYALTSAIWNERTQFDNTVAWARHRISSDGKPVANLLFQDGHVAAVAFDRADAVAVNTSVHFLWQPGEAIDLTPAARIDGNLYPNQTPPSCLTDPPGDVFPNELLPAWYTQHNGWTLISHK